MSKTVSFVRSLTVVGALLGVGATAALANSVVVPNGTVNGGAACSNGNPNAARFSQACGAKVTLATGDTTAAYVQDNSPAAESEYRVRFYYNARGLVTGTLSENRNPKVSLLTGPLTIFAAYDGADPVPPATSGNPVLRVELQPITNATNATPSPPKDGGGNALHVYYRGSDNVEHEATLTGNPFMPAGWRSVEVRWKSGAGNGMLRLKGDGFVLLNATNLNISSTINYVRWGGVDVTSAGLTAPGTLLMDDFSSQRTGYIGHTTPFTDVPKTVPQFAYVQAAYAAEVLPDCGVGTFCPSTGITRRTMARAILRARYGASYVPPVCSTPMFSDVPCSDSEAPWINRMAVEGITSGCSATTYCPNDPVTRGQIMVFLYLASGVTFNGQSCSQAGFAVPFSDVSNTDPFCPYIAQAKADGYAAGTGGGNFTPNGVQRKDDMAVFLASRFFPTRNRELRAPAMPDVEFP